MTFRIELKNYGQINASRIGKMLEADKDKALYMGLWDRFKDVFRSCWGTSKQNQLEMIWNTLLERQISKTPTESHHDGEASLFTSVQATTSERIPECNDEVLQAQITEAIRKISIFNELKLLAEPNYTNSFRVLVTKRGLQFKIGYETVKDVPLPISKDINIIDILNMEVPGKGSILTKLKEYNWDFALDKPDDKNAQTRANYSKQAIMHNKKQAREFYRLAVNSYINQIKDKDAKPKLIKLIIHFNQICNLVLRHDFKGIWKIKEFEEVAEPIFKIINFREEEKMTFLYATLWLNLHRNKGQTAKVFLKSLLVPSGLVGGGVLGLVAGPINLVRRVAFSRRSNLNKLRLIPSALCKGVLWGPVSYGKYYTKAAMAFNTGDSLDTYTTSLKKSINSLFVGYDKSQVALMQASIPSMSAMVKYYQENDFRLGQFVQSCKNNMRNLAISGQLII